MILDGVRIGVGFYVFLNANNRNKLRAVLRMVQ
jgi:ribonucleotide reductase beta subunit family protein with ferritin-like domain